MEQQPLHEQVQVRKATQCATCKSYIYNLPVAVDVSLSTFMDVFGSPLYPLDKFKLYTVRSELIEIKTQIGSKELYVKYQSSYESTSSLFRVKLSDWLKTKK